MKLHLVMPSAVSSTGALPGFITDVRPPARGDVPQQAARATELAGLAGAVVEFDPAGLDPIVLGAGLLRQTRTLQVTVALHPAVGSPVYAAKLAASVQRFTGSRLAWRLVVELDPETARSQGDDLDDRRYERAAEFVTVARAVFERDGVDFSGEFYSVADGGLPPSPRSPRSFPRIYTSGTSPPALSFASAVGDVHLLEVGDDSAVVPDGLAWGVRLGIDQLSQLPRYRALGATEAFVAAADPITAAFALAEVGT